MLRAVVVAVGGVAAVAAAAVEVAHSSVDLFCLVILDPLLLPYRIFCQITLIQLRLRDVR